MYAAADGCQPRGAAEIGSTSGRQAPHALPGRGARHNPGRPGGAEHRDVADTAHFRCTTARSRCC